MPSTTYITAFDVAAGKRIAAFRGACGMSRKSLGDATGVTHQQIAKYETGGNRVSLHMAKKISAVLHITVTQLLDDSADAECIMPDGLKIPTTHMRTYAQLNTKQKAALNHIAAVILKPAAAA